MGDVPQRWTVGGISLTAVVEAATMGIPPGLFFPDVTASDVRDVDWLDDRYAGEAGTVGMAVQAFVVGVGGRTVVVDPCVGDGRDRAFPFWHRQAWGWLDRFTAAGFTPEGIDLVVHTHLHADHVGWATRPGPGGDGWVPTFPHARHVYVGEELDFWRRDGSNDAVLADSVTPIVDAGLADLVEVDADLGHGLRLVPTPGHTPGHVSLEITAGEDSLVVTGDLLHHPAQCTRPEWAEIGDEDRDLARETRRSFLDHHATEGTLLAGTHFPTLPVGRAVPHAGAWRFDPVLPTPKD